MLASWWTLCIFLCTLGSTWLSFFVAGGILHPWLNPGSLKTHIRGYLENMDWRIVNIFWKKQPIHACSGNHNNFGISKSHHLSTDASYHWSLQSSLARLQQPGPRYTNFPVARLLVWILESRSTILDHRLFRCIFLASHLLGVVPRTSYFHYQHIRYHIFLF